MSFTCPSLWLLQPGQQYTMCRRPLQAFWLARMTWHALVAFPLHPLVAHFTVDCWSALRYGVVCGQRDVFRRCTTRKPCRWKAMSVQTPACREHNISGTGATHTKKKRLAAGGRRGSCFFVNTEWTVRSTSCAHREQENEEDTTHRHRAYGVRRQERGWFLGHSARLRGGRAQYEQQC